MGLEGPSLYLGATIGAQAQSRMPRLFRDADRQLLMVAGAAAGVAAIFKAPATGRDLRDRGAVPATTSLGGCCCPRSSPRRPATSRSSRSTAPIASSRSRVSPSFNFRDLIGALALGVAGRARRTRLRRSWCSRPRSCPRSPSIWQPLVAGARTRRDLRDRAHRHGRRPHAWARATTRSRGRSIPTTAPGSCCSCSCSVRGDDRDRRRWRRGWPLHPARGRRRADRTRHRWRGREPQHHALRGDRSRRVPGRRLPRAPRRGDVRRRDDRRPGFVVPGLLAAVAAELTMGRRLDHRRIKPPTPAERRHHPPRVMRSASPLGEPGPCDGLRGKGYRASFLGQHEPAGRNVTQRRGPVDPRLMRLGRAACGRTWRSRSPSAASQRSLVIAQAWLLADVIARAFDDGVAVADVRAPLPVLLVVVVAPRGHRLVHGGVGQPRVEQRQVRAPSRARREARRRTRRPLATSPDRPPDRRSRPTGSTRSTATSRATCLSSCSR